MTNSNKQKIYTFLGAALLTISIIFLLGGLNILKGSQPIVSAEVDAFITFGLGVIGIAYLFLGTKKPSKPEFKVNIK